MRREKEGKRRGRKGSTAGIVLHPKYFGLEPPMSTSAGLILTEFAGTVDDRSEVVLPIPRKTLPWQLILWTKSISNPHIYSSFA